MPFETGNAKLFQDWKAGKQYDPVNDRLLVTTTSGDRFVVWSEPGADEGTTFVIDPYFIPKNLAQIPQALQKRLRQKQDEDHGKSFLSEWDPADSPWRIFVFDGYNFHPDLCAAGMGWTLSIKAGFTVASIEPIQMAEVEPTQVCRELGGMYIGEPEIDYEALFDVLLGQALKRLNPT